MMKNKCSLTNNKETPSCYIKQRTTPYGVVRNLFHLPE